MDKVARTRRADTLRPPMPIVDSTDLSKTYGDLGEGFIECHHKVPVSELKPGAKTKLSDLAVLCANCHRMLHRRRPWLSVDELRRHLGK